MRLTKFGHACVRVEHEGTTVVIDPGAFTAPEAVDGGPIAFVRDGDPITLDVLNRTLEVEIDDLVARKEGWAPKPPKYTRGVLGKYAKIVSSAAHGAVTG